MDVRRCFSTVLLVLSVMACAPTEQMQVTGAAEGNALAAGDFMGGLMGLSAIGLAQNGEFAAASAMLNAAEPLMAPSTAQNSSPSETSAGRGTSQSSSAKTGYCDNPYGGQKARGGYAPEYSGAQFICTPDGWLRGCLCDNSGCTLDTQPGGSNIGCSNPGEVHD